MVRSNPDRERKIRELWLLDHTIDEIELSTGIKRSTVGYYVRKLNKAARKMSARTKVAEELSEGKEMFSKRTHSETPQGSNETFSSVLGKVLSLTDLIEKGTVFIKEGRFDQFYYMLECVKLLPEVLKQYSLTPEELQTSQEMARVLIADSLRRLNSLTSDSKQSQNSGSPTTQPPSSDKEVRPRQKLWRGYPRVKQHTRKIS